MTATVLRPIRGMPGGDLLPGAPYELRGARVERFWFERGFLREGYEAPPLVLPEWDIEAWTDSYDPFMPSFSEPLESSRPHNRKKKVTNAGN